MSIKLYCGNFSGKFKYKDLCNGVSGLRKYKSCKFVLRDIDNF